MTPAAKMARAKAPVRDAQVGLPARRAAAELLSAVLQKKQALDDLLGRSLDKGFMFDLPARDRALVRAIVATSLRRKGQLDHVLGSFLERGLPERSGTLYPILLSAAAQLIFLKTPPHAAIDLAVTLVQYDPKAKRYDRISLREAFDRDLKVLDATAFALARENSMPIIVFSIRKAGAIAAVLSGKGRATIVAG